MAMTNQEHIPTEREEIEMLLPWYVTGRLSPAEQAQVDAYLDSDPEMAAQLELIRSERHETVIGNEAISAPPSGAVDKLIAQVSQSAHAPRSSDWIAEVMRPVREFFSAPTAGAVRWAAAAAAVMLVVQAVTIGTLVVKNEPGSTYGTASGQAETETGTFALVRFAETATARQIADALAEHDLAIVDGPKPGGLFRVRLSNDKMDVRARDARIATLRNKPSVFMLVLPAK
jgi:anti-sigma factor RsiW